MDRIMRVAYCTSVTLGLAFAGVIPEPAAASDVLAGSDVFVTPGAVGGGLTFDDFGGDPIPADFFGPGSDPFDGVIELEGNPFFAPGVPGGVDTVVERLEDAILPDPCNSVDTIDIRIIAVDLISMSPITVTFNGGAASSTYDVRVCLSSVDAQPVGSMTIRHRCPAGGLFDSFLPVIPKLIFTKASGAQGMEEAVLDPAPQLDFTVTDGCWMHQDLHYGIYSALGGSVDHDCDPETEAVEYPPSTPEPDGFIVGLCDMSCYCGRPPFCQLLPPPNPPPRPRLTPEQAAWARHSPAPPKPPAPDTDGDGIDDDTDNCKDDPNPDQQDSDNDTVGDACDICIDTPDPFQEDYNGNGIGDCCDGSIPAVSEWGLLIMVLFGLIAGTIMFRRVRAPEA